MKVNLVQMNSTLSTQFYDSNWHRLGFELISEMSQRLNKNRLGGVDTYLKLLKSYSGYT